MSSLFTDVYSKITIFDGNFPKCSSPGPDIELRIPRQVQARDVARHQHATVLALTTLEWSDWKSLKNIIYKYIVGTSLQLARLRVCNVVCTFYIYMWYLCSAFIRIPVPTEAWTAKGFSSRMLHTRDGVLQRKQVFIWVWADVGHCLALL